MLACKLSVGYYKVYDRAKDDVCMQCSGKFIANKYMASEGIADLKVKTVCLSSASRWYEASMV